MREYVTHTAWRVKPGREADFVRAWQDWAAWSRGEGLVEEPRLLRDVDDQSLFVSSGQWVELSTIHTWRALPGYEERVARLRELVDSFEPRTLEVLRPGKG